MRALVLALGLAPVLAGAADPDVLARFGQAAPGGGTYLVFDSPQINESGIVLFKALVDHGPAGQRQQWFLVDTYASLQPELALDVGPSPDGIGEVTPVVAVLRRHGRAIDFWGSIDTPPPLTGNGAWFARGDDGLVEERLRLGRAIGAGVTGPQIVCAWHLRIHPQGDFLVQAALVEAPDQCEGGGPAGPPATYRIAADHTVTRLVGEGDAIANQTGASIGPSRHFFTTMPLERFSSYWVDASAQARYGLFRLGPDGPELELADGAEVAGIGLVHFEPGLGVINPPRQLHPIGTGGYLGRARVQAAPGQPLREAIVQFGPSGGSVLLEGGQALPGLGYIAYLGTPMVGRTAGLIVGLGETPGSFTGVAALTVDADGLIAMGARTGAALPATGPVDELLGHQMLPSGALVHSVRFHDGWDTEVLVGTAASGPTPLLPPTLQLEEVVYRFELPRGTSDPDLWPVNSRGQVVAKAIPRGMWTPNHLIVYFGGTIFAGDFETP